MIAWKRMLLYNDGNLSDGNTFAQMIPHERDIHPVNAGKLFHIVRVENIVRNFCMLYFIIRTA